MSQQGYPCPECERTFETPQGRGAHRRAAHSVVGSSKTVGQSASQRATAGRLVPCPVCTAHTQRQNLPRHVRAVHHLPWPIPASKLPLDDLQPEPAPPASFLPVPIESNGHSDEPEPLHVADLTGVFVDLLYPSGSLPSAHLSTLFEWRDLTVRAIEQARSIT